MVLSVLGLWLGAANHCLLEDVAALKFLACNPQGQSPSHQDNDCQTDSCASVEQAAFKTEHNQLTIAAPPILQVADLVLTPNEELAPISNGLDVPTSSAASLPAAWRFHFRTAAPPRAPSFIA